MADGETYGDKFLSPSNLKFIPALFETEVSMNREIYEEVKKRISCVQYARDVMGLPIRKAGDRYNITGTKAKNQTIFQNEWFYNFESAEGGDVIALATIHQGDIRSAMEKLCSMAHISYIQDPEFEKKRVKHKQTIDTWAKALPETQRKYLNGRGIQDTTIQKMRIGFDGENIIIPTQYSYVRHLPGSKDKKYRNAYQGETWFVGDTHIENSLIIVEGTLDAVTCIQEGYASMGLLGGNLQSKYLSHIKTHRHGIVLSLDNDDAGHIFAGKAIKKLVKNGIDFKVAIPKDVKDINDYLQKHGEIKTLIDSAIDGALHVVRASKTIHSFKETMESCINKDFMDRCFIHAYQEDKFNSKALKIVEKMLNQVPSEKHYKESYVDNNEVLYHPSMGFFKYDSGAWCNISKQHVKKGVMDILGRFETNRLANNVCGLIEGEVVTSEEFNKKNLFNLKNQTIELDTGVVRDQYPGDMLTIKTQYAYDEKAECPQWFDFLRDITQDNNAKINLIRDMFGYCLFNENILNKAFFLIGNGKNGKSVLLNVLKAIIGHKNITAKSIKQLGNQFTRMDLVNSMVNISDDGDIDLKGHEELFKALVSGSSVDGAKKGKDAIEITPRTKLIFAANEWPEFEDSSFGLERRICVINFKQRFSEHPIGEELKEDNNIQDKLFSELSGIFNWAYEAYLDLRKRRKITALEEQKETMKELKSLNNHVIPFSETLDKDAYDSTTLYTLYKGWCADNLGQRESYYSHRKFGIEMEKLWKKERKADGMWYKRGE